MTTQTFPEGIIPYPEPTATYPEKWCIDKWYFPEGVFNDPPKPMKVIYVSGNYRGKDENEVFDNIIRARSAALRLWRQGWAVICPHTNAMFMGSMLSDTMFMEGDLEILRRSDAIYMLRGFRSSEGAQKELELAMKLNLLIYYEEMEYH